MLAGTGDSLVASWTTIENSCSYRLVYHRIDGGVGDKVYSVESTGKRPGLYGGTRRLKAIVRAPPGVSVGLAAGGALKSNGDIQIIGACGAIHANGDVLLGGDPVLSGDLTASGSFTGSGVPVDTLGNPITPVPGEPNISVPTLVSTDYCGDADFIFTSAGQGLKVSTSESFDFSGGGTYWGWKWNSLGNLWETDSDSLEEGVYCVDGPWRSRCGARR